MPSRIQLYSQTCWKTNETQKHTQEKQINKHSMEDSKTIPNNNDDDNNDLNQITHTHFYGSSCTCV